MATIEDSKKQRGQLATQQQRKASNPLKSVWVQASAGTGKTKVLSDRVLRILLAGGQPNRILCLTYTKAAAVEMSSRISARLSKWAVEPQEKLAQELEALLGSLPQNREAYEALEAKARRLFAVLLDTPGGMKIQTIHSFCQEILKRFPLEARISPYFEVMDERASQEALDEIKKRLLKKIEAEPESKAGQALAFLTQKVSEFSFPKIMNAIAGSRSKISRLFEKYASQEEIAAELAKRLQVNPQDTEERVLAEFWAAADKTRLKNLMQAWFAGGVKDNKKAQALAQVLETGLDAENFAVYKSCFVKSDGGVYASAGSKAALAAYADFVEDYKLEEERCLLVLNKLAAVRLMASTRAVLFLAEDLIKGYNHFKSLHSKMDYEDLIVLTRNLLENPSVAQWVLFKLDGGIDNVLIDEAQDTSPEQWAIIKALTGNFFGDAGASGHSLRTVFAVGDKKQSIYSFQGADPREFEKMRQFYEHEIGDEKQFEKVNLEVSFRSTAAILDVVNQVFKDENAKVGVAGEAEDITHIPFRIGDGGKVELWPLTEPEENENQEVWLPSMERLSVESTSSRLAKQIAERIQKMVMNREILASQNRPVRYRDFMILVQRRNSFVEELVRACKNAQVNIAGVDKIKLLEQIAVQDLVALGKFILLPTDDLTLAEVLKSPLFGLDDDDLFWLCYGRGKGVSLWSRLRENPKYASVYQTLQELTNRADFVRPFELYAFVLNKLKGREKFVARLGLEAEDGIDEFVNLTINYEQEHIPNLQGFIDWIAQDEVEIKRELEQSEADAVRVMTVHGSKGLQAPIVILPDTVRVANVKKESGILWDDLFYYPLSSADYDANCNKIKEEEKSLSLQEYRRLLYVALTRAEDRLCVCGYYKSARSKPGEESWYHICERNLRKIGQENEQQGIDYEIAQEVAVEDKREEKKSAAPLALPEWIKENPQKEEALARPLTPSKMEDDEPALVSPLGENGTSRYRRGAIIHKLLQFMPEIQAEDKASVIVEFLQKNAPDLSEYEQKRLVKEVLDLLENPEFSSLFGPDSKAEVPIMGLAEGRIISGQVDRLVVEAERVLIVDYKTNRPAAKSLNEVPTAYRRQMKAYRDLLAQIYPDKQVETLILWTDTAHLMRLE